ncbi:FHA domain-containing protein [Pseudarthrobacter sp. RMG13]|uniref:FHA domain-containing protein n=1 Tax=Pseudarthrobacter humi TaxID=2952523 RepID=A0ABT1LKB3_9MICC|nr:FHA domain-containing protein [Pseudarthrobacter humi]MCP8998898.1 FHA domain-containing protein [Pseudarthrobacter humi]
MGTATYAAGTWLGVVRANTVVLLGPGTPPALVQSLWELLEHAPKVHEVLHAVTSSFGVSLAEIPSFGIVDSGDALRIFLRGDLDLTVQLPGGPVDLNGRDVTTWTERRLDIPEWYRLTVAGDGQPGDGQPRPVLPLSEGVVLLESLTVSLTAIPVDEVAAPAATPAEVAAPTAVGGVALVADAEPVTATVAEPATEAEPEPELAPEPASEPAPEHDREVSAETVMGLLDDDSNFAAEAAEAEPDLEPALEPAAHPDQVPAHEMTGSYDHLWERTVVRRIEDAAVRDEPGEDHGAPAAPVGAAPAPVDAAQANAPGQPEAAASPAPAHPAHEPAGPPAAPPAAAAAARTIGGLIDSVPWRTGGSTPAAQATLSSNPSALILPPSNLSPVNQPLLTQPPADVPAEVKPGQPAADPDAFDGDHDGHTIMKGDLAGMAAHPAPVPEPDSAAGPLVLARVCGRGHANPPTQAQCAACGSPLPADAVQVARPRLGRMRVSTGALVDLDQSLVIGRQPSVSRVQGGVMPRLVQVASPSGDISRSHVEVRLEGWHVMLCDLKATNGTVLVREGQPPRRLAQNEMAILLDGDIAELGDDVSLRFEEIL